MDTINYDFESQLEQGFQTLFSSIGQTLYIADDVDEKLPDEHIKLEINTGGPNSDEHLNAAGVYDNYTGSIEIRIQTPRVPEQRILEDKYTVSGAGTEAVNGDYVRNGDSGGLPAFTLYESDGITEIYNLWAINSDDVEYLWVITSTAIGDNSISIDVLYDSGYVSDLTPPSSGWTVSGGAAPAPDVVRDGALFKSQHTYLVAITRKAIEEIDANILSTNWPSVLSPTKIKPTGTERENDEEHRATILSYELQFRLT